MGNFVAMDSKSEARSVIFLRADAPASVLFDAASERQCAVLDLLQAIGRCEISGGDATGIAGLARAAALLVSDASSLYEAAQRSESV